MLARQASPVVLRDVAAAGDAQQRVVRLVVVGRGEVDLVGGHDRQRAGVGELEQHRLGLDLVLEAVTLDLDVKPVAENLLERLETLERDLLLPLAQRFADGPVRSAREHDQAVAIRLQALDLDMRGLVLGGVEEGAGGELHEVLPAAVVAGEQRQRAGRLRARLIGAGALQAVGLRPVAEIDLQRAADDRLDAGFRQLVGELERPEQVVGVGQPNCGKAARRRQLGELGDGDGAFQQRIGRMHLEVHELRPLRAIRGARSVSAANRVHGEHCSRKSRRPQGVRAAPKPPLGRLAPQGCIPSRKASSMRAGRARIGRPQRRS